MTRGNQRDKAREANNKKLAAMVSFLFSPPLVAQSESLWTPTGTGFVRLNRSLPDSLCRSFHPTPSANSVLFINSEKGQHSEWYPAGRG